jgi:hypothetical protein
MQVMRINNLDRADKTDRGGLIPRKRTAWHAFAIGWLSGQRRFVPRASTAVNYKFVPPGARNGEHARGG